MSTSSYCVQVLPYLRSPSLWFHLFTLNLLTSTFFIATSRIPLIFEPETPGARATNMEARSASNSVTAEDIVTCYCVLRNTKIRVRFTGSQVFSVEHNNQRITGRITDCCWTDLLCVGVWCCRKCEEENRCGNFLELLSVLAIWTLIGTVNVGIYPAGVLGMYVRSLMRWG